MNALAERYFPPPADAPCPDKPVLRLKYQRLILSLSLVLTDALALGLALEAAFWIRFDIGLTTSPGVVPDSDLYPSAASLMVPFFVVMFAFFGLYQPRKLLGGVREYARVFDACTTATMIVILALFAGHQYIVSRMWLILACFLSFAAVSISRFACRRVVYAFRRRGYLLTPAAVVGTNEEAVNVAADLCDWRSTGLRMVGLLFGDFPQTSQGTRLATLGSTRDISRIVAQYGIEDLIVVVTALSREELLRLCEEVNSLPDVNIRLSSGLYELITSRVTAAALGSVPLITVDKVRLDPRELVVKTILEYSLTAVGLIVLLPVFLAIACAIKLDSPGPIIHRRRVLGISGRQFDAFKLRTMYVDGDSMLSHSPELVNELKSNHKLKQDPRVTRVGRWLRKYSLDELPQLFNVLLGQMGLVGPRMITAAELSNYGRRKLSLLTVKPGITGLWQVNGRSDTSYNDRVELDMYYIRNYSVWLDLQILFVQTLPAVLKSRGAY
jgi:exopolysaccharide biosynthesis polyprenyl glycosylphosphotransferase